jgi:hypothetical protein
MKILRSDIGVEVRPIPGNAVGFHSACPDCIEDRAPNFPMGSIVFPFNPGGQPTSSRPTGPTPPKTIRFTGEKYAYPARCARLQH